MSSLEPGTIVAGRYRLKERIGSGGMGAVWSADHLSLGHGVAIKFLSVTVASNDDARGRFTREAMLAAQLGELSRHVCRVFDHGLLDDGTPYLVMERLQGEALNTRLRRERRLPLDEVVEIVSQLCRALQVAHDAGVVHRDLKPANVFLCEDQDGLYVKLLDFGVAKARLENDAAATTADGTVVGTPAYMSPEQFENSARVDARSDLWSVAAMTYRMVVGCEPFSAPGLSALALRIAVAEPTRPTEEYPSLPRGFDEFIRVGLAKRPENRFGSARALSVALADALRGLTEIGPPTAREPEQELPETAREPEPTNTLSSAVREPTVPGRSRAPLWALGVALVVAAGGAAFALGPRRPTPGVGTAPSGSTETATSAIPSTTPSVGTPEKTGAPSFASVAPPPPSAAKVAEPSAPKGAAGKPTASTSPGVGTKASGTKEPDTWKDDSIQ